MVNNNWVFNGTLMEHQEEGVQRILACKKFLLLDQVGLGKTIQAIACMCRLKEIKKELRVVIACDNDLVHQWVREIKKFTGVDAHSIRDASSAPKRKTLYRQLSSKDSFVLVLNHSKIRVDSEEIQKELRPDFLVFDEAFILSNKNQTSKKAALITSKTSYCLFMTAEPMSRGDAVQLRNLCQVLGYHIGKTEKEFIQNFCVEKATGVYFTDYFGIRQQVMKRVGVKNYDKLHELISRFSLRRGPEVLKDKRLVNPTMIESDMTPDMRKRYLELKESYLRKKDNLTRVEKIATVTFMAQLLCSASLVDTSASSESPKAESLIRLIKNQPEEKFVVFTKWIGMHEILKEKFEKEGIKGEFYSGQKTPEQRAEAIRVFKEDPLTKILVISQAGEKGLNLQNARSIVFIDLLYTPSSMRQLIGRVNRIGQVSPIINVYYLTLHGSSEEKVMQTLIDRQSTMDKIFKEDNTGYFEDVEMVDDSVFDLLPS